MFFCLSVCALILNGPFEEVSWAREEILAADQVIAADGGANHLHALGITPDLIVGDMDSIDPEVMEAFEKVPRLRFPPEKDHTDFELAIEVATSTPIYLYGAFGGRADHTLANTLEVMKDPRLEIHRKGEVLRLLTVGEERFKTVSGQTLSLIALMGPALFAESSGLKWPLHDLTLSPGGRGVSNVCTGEEVEIVLKEGKVLMSLHSDGMR